MTEHTYTNRDREIKGKRDIKVASLIHFQNACNSQGWARLKEPEIPYRPYRGWWEVQVL